MNLYRLKAKSITFFLCLLFSQTVLFAQSNIKITIKNSEMSLQQALAEVEKQSKMSVAYNESQLGNTKRISLSINGQTLDQALTTILKGTGFSYKVKDGYIMIVPDQKEKATTKKIKGKVVDDQGESLIGVNISVNGTSIGTITDIDGNFTIDASKNDVLKISYIGYATQNVKILDKDVYNITMLADAEQLEEVVVTALGIKRTTKSLTYNVQELKGDDLTTAKDANFINSLAGKVAGVTINQSASGVGGSTRVVMRGTKSLFGENNALYVVDGIPLTSMKSDQNANFYESADGGDSDGISSINPDDIESMSVLSGAAAAALYGSQGANGVILITTKKGTEGKLKINYVNDTQFMSPFVMPEFQNTYGSPEETFSSWGDKLETPSSWKPKDFFQTGYVETNSVSLSAGSDRNQTYFSAASTNARDIMPKTKYYRYNFSMRNTTELIKDKLTLDLGASYIITANNNMAAQGQYHNPLVPLYLFPRGDDMNKYKVFERYNSELYYDTQFWPYKEQGLGMQNPYWIVNREKFTNNKSRYIFTGNINYKATDWLNLVARIRIDNSEDTYQRKISASSSTLFASEYGNYMNMQTKYRNIYGDVMAQINKRFNDDWAIVANAGASIDNPKKSMIGYEGHLLTVPNLFSFSNIDRNSAQTKPLQSGGKPIGNQSVFATFQLGYKSWAFLDVTGRNDWCSSLSYTSHERSGFFYPSVGLSAVISEMVDLSKAGISFLKVRGSYSEVGNAPVEFITMTNYPVEGGKLETLPNVPADFLEPERTKAFEVGANIRFFRDLLSLDITYYNSNTYNQLFTFTMPPSTGYRSLYMNAGKVNNWGIEANLGLKTKLGPVKWNSNVTFTLNRNEIKELLPEDARNPITGTLLNTTEIEPFSPQGSYKMILKKGGTMNDIYVTGLAVDHQGNIKINPQTGAMSTDPNTWIKAGSNAPRFNWGWNNNFNYKGINLSFLIDARIGGVGVSATQALMDRFGTSKTTAIARDNGGVMVNGSLINAEDYYSVTGSGSTGALAHYVYSMTNVRLRELSLGYTLPTKLFNNAISNLTVSFIGKNLFMFYNKAPFDPEITASTGTYYQGFDYFMRPSLRSVGFSVKFQY